MAAAAAGRCVNLVGHKGRPASAIQVELPAARRAHLSKLRRPDMQRLASKANVPIEVLNPPPVLCVGGKCYASSRCSQKKPSENALSPPAAHIFTTDEAATAYALSAERILGGDSLFLDRNPAVVPVFVSQLFQSLEISIKHAGIHSGLFTEAEARSRQMRSGHGISEIADLAVERLCGQPHDPLVQALTYFHTEHNAAEIIRRPCKSPPARTNACSAG